MSKGNGHVVWPATDAGFSGDYDDLINTPAIPTEQPGWSIFATASGNLVSNAYNWELFGSGITLPGGQGMPSPWRDLELVGMSLITTNSVLLNVQCIGRNEADTQSFTGFVGGVTGTRHRTTFNDTPIVFNGFPHINFRTGQGNVDVGNAVVQAFFRIRR